MTSTFTVSYTGFSPEAETAFQCAIDILSRRVVSPVPVAVVAEWKALGAGILGSAGANYYVRDFSGAPVAGTYYAAPLANALRGSDLYPSDHDIDADFNSSFSNWYLGTDGNPPPGTYDFVTVVLHEVIHGLGFADSFNKTGSNGSWGLANPPRPVAYDRFVVNGSGQSLIDTVLFGNPSAALGSQLTSNSVFWNGPRAVAGNSGVNPKLYAPTTWSSGSSIAHLDDATFDGSVDGLMTHALAGAESDQELGPVVSGVLRDIGWSLVATAMQFGVQPGGATSGQPLAPQPSVAVKDATGATATGDNTTVITLALEGGPGTLSCTGGLSKTVVAGVAAFGGCSVTGAGSYTLQATSTPVLAPVSSSSFSVTGVLARHQLSAVTIGSEVVVFGRSPGSDLWFRETAGGAFGGWTFAASGIAGRPEAVAAGPELYVFYRGTGASDLRYVKRTGSGPFGGPVSLGGAIAGNPVAAVDGDGELVVVVENAVGELYWQRLSGGSWSGYTQMTGILSSQLELVPHAGDLHLFGLNLAGQPWTRTWSASGDAWGSWTGLDGLLAGSVSAVSYGSDLYAFGTNAGGQPWYRRYTTGSWAWWETPGGLLDGPPGLAVSGSKLLMVGVNPGGESWVRELTGGTWGGWQSLGGVLGAGPEVASNGTLAWEFGLDPAGGLWYRSWDGATWLAWTSLGGMLASE